MGFIHWTKGVCTQTIFIMSNIVYVIFKLYPCRMIRIRHLGTRTWTRTYQLVTRTWTGTCQLVTRLQLWDKLLFIGYCIGTGTHGIHIGQW